MADKLLFVLTDGGRARFVERSRETGDFATIEEIDNSAQLRQLRRELRASPPARVFQSQGEHRHAVGPSDYLRPAKEAFVSRVAERASEVARSHHADAVVVAAPRRLAGLLRRRLEQGLRVADVVGKDLTKTPDHELGAWLGGIVPGQRAEEGRA